jgi:hypothetical protein
VHQITTTITTTRVTYRKQYRVVNGKRVLQKKIVGRKDLGSRTTTKLDKTGRRKLLAYLKEMGIDTALLEAIESTPSHDIRRLGQDEMLKLGLITGPESTDALTAPAICAVEPAAGNCRVIEAVEAKAE